MIEAYEGGRPAGEPPIAALRATVPGIDVSSYQGNVDWRAQYNAGKRFA